MSLLLYRHIFLFVVLFIQWTDSTSMGAFTTSNLDQLRTNDRFIHQSSKFTMFNNKSKKNRNKKGGQSNISIDSILEGLAKDYEKEVAPSVINFFDSLIKACKEFNVEDFIIEIKRNICRQYKDFSALSVPIKTLVIAQVMIWMAWQVCPPEFMLRHFTDSSHNDNSSRGWYTWMTSSISHYELTHLIGNLSVFLIFGTVTHSIVGTNLFMNIVISSAFITSAIPKFINNIFGRIFPNVRKRGHTGMSLAYVEAGGRLPSLGFSGVNCCLAVLFASARPNVDIDFIETIGGGPQKSRVFLRRAILTDVIGLLMSNAFIAHGAHLSGYLWGIAVLDFICANKIGSKKSRRQLCAE